MLIYLAAFALVTYSILVIFCECVLFQPNLTIAYQMVHSSKSFTLTYILTLFFLYSLTFYCIFTLTNIKFIDFYNLVPFHTDCLSLSSVTSLCSKCVSVLLVNYIIMLGLKSADSSENSPTGFAEFYTSMIQVPYYNIYY
jgi:hypothetical protein